VADANKVITILKANIADLMLQNAILRAEAEEHQEAEAQKMGLVPVANMEAE
jgi:hypothetical protein